MELTVKKSFAKSLWLKSQGLDRTAPFGAGPQATPRAVEHLGYLQIDTINVIERCHHHILFSRIPDYQRSHLHQAQTKDKNIFEYWTHALSYVPTKDFRFFVPTMKRIAKSPDEFFKRFKKEELQRVLKLVKTNGALSIRDIEDDVLVEKTHAWDSRKPSKKALQWGFHRGDLVITERQGMLKRYELTKRHFEWRTLPKAATEKEVVDYWIDRALRSQGLVSLDSICHLRPKNKAVVLKNLEGRVKKGLLASTYIENLTKNQFWIDPIMLDLKLEPTNLVHILSPFDPLIIQRKRLHAIFDYEHIFEAYIPKQKRVFGYFSLPILIGDRVVAVLDLKTDRENRKLLIQQWTWLQKNKTSANRSLIESELHRFEKFQLSN